MLVLIIILCLCISAVALARAMAGIRKKEVEVYCEKCGEDRPYSKYCPKCGLVVSPKPSCDCGASYNPIRDGGDYCMHCGKQLEIIPSPRASDK